MADLTKVEYRVRKIERYVVTRFHGMSEGTPGNYADAGRGVETKGEYENETIAFEVAYALCKAEHDRLGWPLDDERIQYPRHPGEAGCVKLEPSNA